MTSRVFRARQVEAIRQALAEAREVIRQAGECTPQAFLRAFVAAGGPRRPGDDDPDSRDGFGRRLLELAHAGGEPADADLRRELERARNEAAWAAALEDDSVVGFYLDLPPAARQDPVVEALSHQMAGLGPGVVPRSAVLVLQPVCDGVRFVPVRDFEVEC